MPNAEELFGKSMGWPRLCLKFGVEALLTYNFYHYATTEKNAWDCYATSFRQPNPGPNDGILPEGLTDYGVNMTD